MSRTVNIRLMMVVVFVSTFMDGLDGSIVNMAIPTMASEFGMDVSTMSWITTSYMLTLAGLLVVFAKISTNIGPKRVMLWGLAVFTAASLLCGMSDSFETLLIFRISQGVGAAMMCSSGPILCTENLTGKEVGTGIAVISAGSALGFAMGPGVGGMLLEVMPWNGIFLINVPLGLFMMVITAMALPTVSNIGRAAFDWKGAVLLFVSIVSLTFGIESITSGDVMIPAVSLMVSAVTLLMFLKVERSAGEPLLNTGMFRLKGFSPVFITLLLMNAAYMGILYLTPFYCQLCMGIGVMETGLMMVVSAVVASGFSIPFGKISNRVGRRVFGIGSGLMFILSMLLLLVFAEGMTLPILFASMVLKGLGWAMFGGPMGANLVEHAGEDRDMASSMMNEAYYIGAAVGTATLAMFFSVTSSTMGIDIGTISPDVFLDGFVPSLVLLMVMGLVVSLLSSGVRDRMSPHNQ